MRALPRARGAELMDAPEVDPAELERSLADLQRVNRWLGGTRIVLGALAAMLRRLPRERSYRVLDVATGSADVPLALAAWARQHCFHLRIVAVDSHPRTLEVARRHAASAPEVEVLPGDARALPFADRSFDFALCSTALHHFDEAEAVQVLRELGRVAKRGVVVNDLVRSRFGLAAVRLMAATAWREHPVTRHDGPLSVRRSYTLAEARELARRAGLGAVRVRAHWPWNRFSLVVDRTRRREG